MQVEMTTRDIFLRHTDKDGHSVVREHRVWNSDLFITSQAEAALKEGGKALVQQITREQYLAERAA
jgi:hypothetical protein